MAIQIPGPLDSVPFDEHHQRVHAALKEQYTRLHNMISQNVMSPRARALALTNLEQSFLWLGRAIREDQIGTNLAKASQSAGSES